MNKNLLEKIKTDEKEFSWLVATHKKKRKSAFYYHNDLTATPIELQKDKHEACAETALPVIYCENCKFWKKRSETLGICEREPFTPNDHTEDYVTYFDDFCIYCKPLRDGQEVY